MRHTSLALILLTISGSMATAQTSTPGIDARQTNQDQRIQQGVNSGQLNAKETYRLEQGQARVQALEDKAKSDGVVTNAERARIQAAQDRQSQKIYNEKHDAQTAGGSAANTGTIDQRQANQNARIQQGVASGQLNAKETFQLEKGQARVQQLETKAKADGVVTNRERARIKQAQNVQSKRIYNKKHN